MHAFASVDTVAIAPGYTATVLAPWGTPLLTGAPTWKADGSDDAASQAMQVGDNHDGIHFFPMDGRSDEGLLVINHEYTTVENGEYIWLFGRECRKVLSPERVAKAMNAHGISILHVTRNASGKWQVKPRSLYNRRITASTQMKLAGPAAGAAALRTRSDPSGRRVLGTFNNCGNGWTPWNTYLACEENFNTYFGSASQSDTRTAAQKRYGIEPGATAYGWEKFAERFDYAREPNECNRYGWIVEIDPFDPKAQPRKRTALGRFKHENAAVTLAADKRVVVYMGDDQRGEYLYKFVSEAAFHPSRYNPDLLDAGRLYVARFDDGEVEGDFMGRGEWIPLDKAANPDLAADTRFANQADVLIHTRLAADAVGATKMDRPEWVTVHPHSGEVYATLTNNDKRAEVNPPNPRKENVYGQIIRWREAGGDAAATAFEWDLFVLAGNPAVYTDRLDPKSGSANITPDNMFNSSDGGTAIPRSATLVITKDDGGIVGT